MNTLPRIVSVLAVLVALAFVSRFAGAQQAAPLALETFVATPHSQGCVNQGSDRRDFGAVVCFLQRHLSWKSNHAPHMAWLGAGHSPRLGAAWPPYLVVNLPAGTGHWLMFRLGFRYDDYWRGYIFPTAAAKRLPYLLRY